MMGQSPQNADDSNDFADDEFAGLESQLDNTQELVWALLDEHISDANFAELEERLLADKAARETYIHCVQMHVDLTTHFAPSTEPREASKTATSVLGFLGEGLPTSGTPQANQPI
jgi:hypothetical protein